MARSMLEDVLKRLLKIPVRVVDIRGLGGGCISEVSAVTIAVDDSAISDLPAFADSIDPSDRSVVVVVKRNSTAMEDNFRCEAEGLRAIGASESIRVPIVHAVGAVDGEAYLVMEMIPSGQRPSAGHFRRFGEQLAKLHRATAGNRVGWECDNYLGSARQPNPVGTDWNAFFAEHRIGFQSRWARDQGVASAGLQSDCERIANRIDELLAGREDSTSLIHGDLWSGNYLFDDRDQPTLLDPAVYYGCREAEWGMISWFGGCRAEFTEAYQDHWPMPDGWQRRVAVYRLYHQLNHLNLFGGAYASECQHTASTILRS